MNTQANRTKKAFRTNAQFLSCCCYYASHNKHNYMLILFYYTFLCVYRDRSNHRLTAALDFSFCIILHFYFIIFVQQKRFLKISGEMVVDGWWENCNSKGFQFTRADVDGVLAWDFSFPNFAPWSFFFCLCQQHMSTMTIYYAIDMLTQTNNLREHFSIWLYPHRFLI